MHIDEATTRRFWSKVDWLHGWGATEPCWEWQAARFAGKDYGVFRYEGKNWRAHRFAYLLTHGDIPEGLVVRHTCDNPACCNPAHLVPGTNADNSGDMVEKGRSLKGVDTVPPQRRARGDRSGARTHPERRPRGDTHVHSKLSDDLVREIRSRHAAGESQDAIARSIGISQSAAGRVILRQTWKHVD